VVNASPIRVKKGGRRDRGFEAPHALVEFGGQFSMPARVGRP
jgi:hypothetical protein